MNFLYVIAFILLLPASAVSSEETPTGEFLKKETPIQITADELSYEKETDTYYARGNVVIVQDSTSLVTEEAMLNMAAGVATARGDVTIIDEGGNTLKGRDLQLDIRKKTAVLARGRLFYREENVHLTGSPIKKVGDRSYEIGGGTYTTCDCPEEESPAWSFYARSAYVTVGEYLVARSAYFYIKDVPVLYTPYARIPVKRKRQSGFLQPKPGYSELRGFKLDNSFFWAISDHSDATFFLDIETKRGLGKGVEFRYYRTRKSYGEWFFYHFREEDIERVREFRSGVANLSRPKSASEDRWEAKLVHTEQLGAGFVLKANMNVVSDDEYYIDFGEGSTQRSVESLESNISLTRVWSAYSFVVQLRRFDNLLSETDSDTLQKYPEVTLNGSEQKLLGPFYHSFETSLVNFERKEGVDGGRLDIKPRLSLPSSPGGYFELTPSISPRATFYLVNGDPGGRYVDRYLYEARVDATTTFVRIFRFNGDNLTALRHTVRPKLSYSYIPQANQYDIPSFDAVDNIPATNTVTYSLNSTLTGKFPGEPSPVYRDHLYLDISQSYNINEATRKLTSDTDKRRPFSDIAGEVIIKPTARTKLNARGIYDVYDNWFESYDAAFEGSVEQGSALNLTYRYVRDGASYFEGSMRGRISERVDLTYRKRYSIDDHRALENEYGLEYRHQCWDALLTYTERLEERIVFLTFNLRGLGRVAGLKGKIEPL